MGDVKLSCPRVTVVRDGQPDLELQTTNADMVLWDLTRPRQRPAWPTFQDAPFLWLTFLAWAAARRMGAIEPGYTFERWRDEVLDVSSADEDGETPDELGAPFPQVPGPG
jgi:hypothetical protein